MISNNSAILVYLLIGAVFAFYVARKSDMGGGIIGRAIVFGYILPYWFYFFIGWVLYKAYKHYTKSK